MTARQDLKRRLQDAATLPESVQMLKDFYGSDDKLAARLETSRQRVIAWRQGSSHPSQVYREKLRREGVRDDLLGSAADARASVEERLAALEAAVRALRDAPGRN